MDIILVLKAAIKIGVTAMQKALFVYRPEPAKSHMIEASFSHPGSDAFRVERGGIEQRGFNQVIGAVCRPISIRRG
jgi:hypothetical protein